MVEFQIDARIKEIATRAVAHIKSLEATIESLQAQIHNYEMQLALHAQQQADVSNILQTGLLGPLEAHIPTTPLPGAHT